MKQLRAQKLRRATVRNRDPVDLDGRDGSGAPWDMDIYQTSASAVGFEDAPRLPLRIAEFPSRGRGVLAHVAISPGQVIERSPVIIVPEKDRPAVDASSVGNHIFMWEHDTVGDDLYSQKGRAAVVLGFASLVNHSADPNCRFIRHIEARALDLVAIRDIEAGEELTFDYGMELWFTPS